MDSSSDLKAVNYAALQVLRAKPLFQLESKCGRVRAVYRPVVIQTLKQLHDAEAEQ